MTKRSYFTLSYSALGAAFLAVSSQISFRLGPIPFTMQTLAVALLSLIFYYKEATLSVALYLLLGALGLPIFSGFQGGFHHIFGPTGGFLIGFLAFAIVTSFITGPKTPIPLAFLSSLLGDLLCFICGILVFQINTQKDFWTSFNLTTLPFLLPEVIKCLLAAILAKLFLKQQKGKSYWQQ